MDYIAALEVAIGVKAKKNMMPIQSSDVVEIWADISLLKRLVGNVTNTPVEVRVKRVVEWYKQYKDFTQMRVIDNEN